MWTFTETTLNSDDGLGWLWTVGVAALPVPLQPLIVVSLAANMSALRLCTVILVGRTIKYLIMAELATSGSQYLAFFGSAAVNSRAALLNKKE